MEISTSPGFLNYLAISWVRVSPSEMQLEAHFSNIFAADGEEGNFRPSLITCIRDERGISRCSICFWPNAASHDTIFCRSAVAQGVGCCSAAVVALGVQLGSAGRRQRSSTAQGVGSGSVAAQGGGSTARQLRALAAAACQCRALAASAQLGSAGRWQLQRSGGAQWCLRRAAVAQFGSAGRWQRQRGS
jgi:hypothetical protein